MRQYRLFQVCLEVDNKELAGRREEWGGFFSVQMPREKNLE